MRAPEVELMAKADTKFASWFATYRKFPDLLTATAAGSVPFG